MNTKTFNILIICVLLVGLLSSCDNTANEKTDRISTRNAILNQINPPQVRQNAVSILEFGAVADSVSDCKPAFDAAIKVCSEKRNIRLIVPAGIYLINGPLHLADNICIELQKGARLKFSNNPGHYLPVVLTSWEGTFLHNYSPFIYGYQLENIIITGEGIIDGNASGSFTEWKVKQKASQMLSREMNHKNVPVEERIFGEGHFLRPHLMQFFECKNILIEDVHITNSPFWCIHLLKSENAVIRGLSFDAKNPNNDGIDPEYSKNILIEDIDFDNGDDNVAIKAGRDHEGRLTAKTTENIIIRNCRFKGLHGVVIGSEMSAGVQNVFVENCTFGGFCKRGIYLKSNPDRGGFIRNIFVNNVHFGEVEDAFYVTSFYHGEGKGFETDIQQIFVDSFYCRKANNAGIVIEGFPGKKVKNISFTNFQIDTAKVAISINNAENIMFAEVNIGGVVKGMPSFAK